NISSIQSREARDDYSYDALDRLVSATHTPTTGPASSFRFKYDESGNLVWNSVIGDFVYGSNKPHAVKSAGAYHYSYDSNGNIATAPHYKFLFDPLSRLVEVHQTDGFPIGRLHLLMTYTATGERVITTKNGESTINLDDAFRCNSHGCVRILYGGH